MKVSALFMISYVSHPYRYQIKYHIVHDSERFEILSHLQVNKLSGYNVPEDKVLQVTDKGHSYS